MGCATMKEKNESQIMLLKIERAEIGKEREEKIKQLEEMTGEKIYRKPIPDYLLLNDNTKDSSNDDSIKKKKRRSSSKKSISDRHNLHNSRITSSRTKISSSQKSFNDSDYNIKRINIKKRKSIEKKYSKRNKRISEVSESESDEERIHSYKQNRKKRY